MSAPTIPPGYDDDDDDVADGVMVAFLPINADWCKLDLPHLTLVFGGSKAALTPTDFNALAKDAATIAMLTSPFSLDVMGLDVFGPEDDRVNVLRFRPTPELFAMRSIVEKWDKSEFPTYKPHSTIGPATDLTPIYPPRCVGFNRVIVAWGEDQLVFNLKTTY